MLMIIAVLTTFKEYLGTSFHMKVLAKLKYFSIWKWLAMMIKAFFCHKDRGMLGSKPVYFLMEQQHGLAFNKSPLFGQLV